MTEPNSIISLSHCVGFRVCFDDAFSFLKIQWSDKTSYFLFRCHPPLPSVSIFALMISGTICVFLNIIFLPSLSVYFVMWPVWEKNKKGRIWCGCCRSRTASSIPPTLEGGEWEWLIITLVITLPPADKWSVAALIKPIDERGEITPEVRTIV